MDLVQLAVRSTTGLIQLSGVTALALYWGFVAHQSAGRVSRGNIIKHRGIQVSCVVSTKLPDPHKSDRRSW